LDRRGSGVSDPLPPSDDPFLENFNDDLVAVLDDAGFARPAIVAGDSAGLMAIVFAASQPTRVSSLVLVSAYANRAGGDEDVARFQSDYTLRLFSQGEGVELLAPTLWRDPSAIA